MTAQNARAAIQSALQNDLTIDIVTTGARTGKPRTTEIWFCMPGDMIIITGTPGPRDWYANLLANAQFVFRLKESLHAEVAAVATPILDPLRRRAIFTHQATVWYRDRAGVDALVAGSPLVAVDLTLPAD